jgi:hypothetical protein
MRSSGGRNFKHIPVGIEHAIAEVESLIGAIHTQGRRITLPFLLFRIYIYRFLHTYAEPSHDWVPRSEAFSRLPGIDLGMDSARGTSAVFRAMGFVRGNGPR